MCAVIRPLPGLRNGYCEIFSSLFSGKDPEDFRREEFDEQKIEIESRIEKILRQ